MPERITASFDPARKSNIMKWRLTQSINGEMADECFATLADAVIALRERVHHWRHAQRNPRHSANKSGARTFELREKRRGAMEHVGFLTISRL